MEAGSDCQAYSPNIDLKKHHQRHSQEHHDGQERITDNHIDVPSDEATKQKRKKSMQKKSPQGQQR
jgi:hypothetical protein